MSAEVIGLVEEGGRIAGLVADTPDGAVTIRAALVVGADGRNSVVRGKAGLEVESFGAPSDVLWMKLSHQPDDPPYTMGHGGPRQGFVMVDRGDYWQCGYVVRKGTFAEVKEKGIEAFRTAVAAVSPLPAARVEEIRSWDDVHLLSIRINASGNGGGRGSCASATPRTPCRPSAGCMQVTLQREHQKTTVFAEHR